jgi:hypothetical protein
MFHLQISYCIFVSDTERERERPKQNKCWIWIKLRHLHAFFGLPLYGGEWSVLRSDDLYVLNKDCPEPTDQEAERSQDRFEFGNEEWNSDSDIGNEAPAADFVNLLYEGVSKSSRTGRLERELQLVQLSATMCSCNAILWASLVSFAAITPRVASQRVIPKVSVYFAIESVRKLLDTLSYMYRHFEFHVFSTTDFLAWDSYSWYQQMISSRMRHFPGDVPIPDDRMI